MRRLSCLLIVLLVTGFRNGWIFSCELNDTTVRQELSFYLSNQTGSLLRCGPISQWDVGQVTDFKFLFCSAGYGRTHTFDGILYCGDDMSNFNADISLWNTASATSLRSTFSHARSFNADISQWNVGRVTDMMYTFSSASTFNRSLSSWDVAKVTRLLNTFEYATSFDQDLDSWDVSSVQITQSMFRGTTHFNGNIGSWNTASVTSFRFMFEDSEAFNQDIGSWSLEAVDGDGIENMFEGSQVFQGELNGWNIERVESLNGVFESSQYNGDVSQWNTAKVTTLRSTFSQSIFNGNIGAWDVGRVRTFESTFYMNARFNGDLSAWDTSSAETFNRMFLQATAYNGSMDGWRTQNVVDFFLMFYEATTFDQDLSSWTITEGANLRLMFHGTSNLSDCNKYNIYKSWHTSPAWPSMYDVYSLAGSDEICASNEPTQGESTSGSQNTIIIVSTIVPFVTVVLTMLYCVMRHAKRSQDAYKLKANSAIERIAKQERELATLSEAWELNFDDVEIKKRLASGTFGEVFEGTYLGKFHVALKRLDHNTVSKSIHDETEIRFLQRMRHERLVMFFGAGKDRKGRIFLVLEYMDMGSLNILLSNSSRKISWQQRSLILRDVVQGMVYLHDVHQSSHSDLKSANIMLTAKESRGSLLRAKVGDFNLAKFVSTQSKKTIHVASLSIDVMMGRPSKASEDSESPGATESYGSSTSTFSSVSSASDTTPRGTPTHMSPELLSKMFLPTFELEIEAEAKSSDVYAFGVVMWEVLERSKPWAACSFAREIADAAVKGRRPPISAAALRSMPRDGRKPTSREYVDAIERAWHQDPSKRPAFSALEKIMEAWDIYEEGSGREGGKAPGGE